MVDKMVFGVDKWKKDLITMFFLCYQVFIDVNSP